MLKRNNRLLIFGIVFVFSGCKWKQSEKGDSVSCSEISGVKTLVNGLNDTLEFEYQIEKDTLYSISYSPYDKECKKRNPILIMNKNSYEFSYSYFKLNPGDCSTFPPIEGTISCLLDSIIRINDTDSVFYFKVATINYLSKGNLDISSIRSFGFSKLRGFIYYKIETIENKFEDKIPF